MVVWPISFILLQHEGNVLIRSITFHLAKAHGASVNAACTYDTGDLGVHEGSVATLSLRACDSTMTSTVVVQELSWEVSASNGHSSASSNITIHQEGAILSQWSKLGKDVLATGNHFIWVISSDVSGEELALGSAGKVWR